MRFLSSRTFLVISVLSILLLGAYLRLYRIGDYLTFLGDEGRDALIVKRMIVDHNFVLLGPTASVGGFFLGPMYYYFMAPFLWLFQLDPVGPAVMVALFGTATIYMVFLVGKAFFNQWVGLIASSLYAVSPIIIAYARSSWNPNLVPFFSLLLIYLLWRFSLLKSRRDLIGIGLIWGLGIQFHYLFSFLIVFSILWVIGVERSWKAIKSVGTMIVSSAVTFSPFIIFELRHSFPNTRALINFFLHGSETGFNGGTFFSIVSDVAFRSVGRLLFRMPNYDVWSKFPQWQIALLQILVKTTLWISILLLLVMGLSQLSQLSKRLRGTLKNKFPLDKHQWVGSVLLFSWFIFSVFLFGFYRRGIYDYYFGIFYAFPFLSLGVIFWQMMRSRVGIAIVFTLWAGLTIYNWQGRPFIYQPNKQLDQTKKIDQAALKMTQGKPFNFALITATNSDQAYRYFFEIWGHKPVVIEQPAVDPERKSITDQLIVFCENTCEPLGNSLWDVAGFGRAEITSQESVFPIKIFRLVHYQEKL